MSRNPFAAALRNYRQRIKPGKRPEPIIDEHEDDTLEPTEWR